MLDPLWLWAVLGVILLAVEIGVGTFDILWFGIAALCISLVLWLFPETPIAAQFIIFALLSLASLAIWRSYYKKNEKHYRVGQAQGQEIGRIGTVITACSPTASGKIRFAQGLMGDKEWTAVANEAINIGTEAEVVAVEGNSLRIKSISIH